MIVLLFGSDHDGDTQAHSNSSQNIAGIPADKRFNVVDYLIGQGLYRFIAGPGHMRRDNKIR
jgi:hypothetical protein